VVIVMAADSNPASARVSGGGHFLRLQKLKASNHISVAANHNLRAFAPEACPSHIDSSRTPHNIFLAGGETVKAVVAEAKRLTSSAGITKYRKNAVRGIEGLFSLPPKSTIDLVAYYTDCLEWTKTQFSVPVLSAVIHLDEAAPHMHIILLPLLDGRLQGSKLMGNRTRLKALHDDFYLKVGGKYGLSRPQRQRQLSHATRHKAAEIGVYAILDNPDLLLREDVENAVIHAISKNPEPLLSCLGIPMPQEIKPHRSFVEIMTQPCKPDGLAVR